MPGMFSPTGADFETCLECGEQVAWTFAYGWIHSDQGTESAHAPELAVTEVEPGGRLRFDAEGRPIVDLLTCGTCGRTWNDAVITSRTPSPAGRCPFEYEHEDNDAPDHDAPEYGEHRFNPAFCGKCGGACQMRNDGVTFDGLMRQVLSIWPDAVLSEDDDGQVVVFTGIKLGGSDGK